MSCAGDFGQPRSASTARPTAVIVASTLGMVLSIPSENRIICRAAAELDFILNYDTRLRLTAARQVKYRLGRDAGSELEE